MLMTPAPAIEVGASAAEPAIRVSNVGKTFMTRDGPLEAVRDASLHVGRGEFVAILGPSGCGKSTLMLMCAGLEKPSRGQIAIDGERCWRRGLATGIMSRIRRCCPG